VVTLYIRYKLYLKWYQVRGLLTEYDNLIGTQWWKALTLEIIIALFAPYPFLQGYKYHEICENWKTDIYYEWNHILACMSFCRIYVVFRYTFSVSKFMNPRSKRVCMMNGCEANHLFALKAIMKEMPYTFITVSLAVSILLFGYCLKVFESPLS
jgi:hypothetical protein